ncbi:MAG TPA: folylpolyglutamate synthase/dihydrofolate synthase family protein [Symbiobacteriaceae bacterium]
MTYEEARAYLRSLRRFGIKPGLERTRELLRRLGHPERRVGRVIHITGTSGKGSVAAMVEAGLRAAGYRVGLYTSPALQRFTERMQVDRREIAREEVAALIATVRRQVEAMVSEGWEQPTEFEVITAAAFQYFARQQVDWLVLEVGLGGRYDATNVVPYPAITCITNIGLDHTQWLGSTHEEIARDKAGIIKPGVPCVTGTDHPGALAVIREIALSQEAPLVEVTPEDWRVVSFGLDGQVLDLLGARGWYRGLRLPLLGEHQAANAAVALRVLELAGVPAEAIRQGLAEVVWPGRMELVFTAAGVPVLLDAAHNPAKCGALAAAVRRYFPGRRVLLVLGVLADKEVPGMLQPLLDLAAQVWVAAPESPRALPAPELQGLCRSFGCEAVAMPSVVDALEAALAAAGPGDLVLVTGSFYTVRPARRYMHPGQDA